MKNRTVIFILSVATLLLLFIVFVERDMMTSSQIDERKDRVFVDFDQNLVDEFTIEKKGQPPVTLKRVNTTGNAGGDWQIVSPKNFAASEGEIRMMLSSIDFLLISRKIEGQSFKKDPAYGLETPQIVVSYTMRGKRTAFMLGAETKDEKIYLEVEGSADTFYAVEKEFLTSFDKSLSDLRSKKVFTQSLAMAESLELQGAKEPIKLRRDKDGTWKINSDSAPILAAEDQVSQLIQTLGDIEAHSFTEDDVDENGLQKYGLQNPPIAVKIKLPNGKTWELLIGNGCPDEENTRQVTISGTGSVVCAADTFLTVLSRPKDRFIEKRIAVFEKDDITLLSLFEGDKHISFHKTDGAWNFDEDGQGDVEQQAITKLLEELGTTRATEVQGGARATAGLDAPVAKMTLSSGDNYKEIVLNIFKDTRKENLWVRRGEEHALLTIAPGLLDRIRPSHLAFLKRTIEISEKDKLERFEIRAPISQTLVKKDGLWNLTEPLAALSDGMAVRSLAELLSNIQVVEYAATKPLESHGFNKPYGVIVSHFAVEENTAAGQDLTKSKKVILEIGQQAAAKGRYARIRDGGSPIFIVGQPYIQALEQPLVARDLMQIDASNLAGLTLESRTQKRELKRGEKNWSDAQGNTLDLDKLNKILADLGGTNTIRAVAFEKNEQQLDPPTLTIKTIPKEGAEDASAQTFVFGRKSADENEDGYFARRADTPVTFVYPARVVDATISLLETTTPDH